MLVEPGKQLAAFPSFRWSGRPGRCPGRGGPACGPSGCTSLSARVKRVRARAAPVGRGKPGRPPTVPPAARSRRSCSASASGGVLQGARLAVRPDLPRCSPRRRSVAVPAGPAAPCAVCPRPISTRSGRCRWESEGSVRPGRRSSRVSVPVHEPQVARRAIDRLVIERSNDTISRCHRNCLRVQGVAVKKLTQSGRKPSTGPPPPMPAEVFTTCIWPEDPAIARLRASSHSDADYRQDRREKGRPTGSPSRRKWDSSFSVNTSLYFRQPRPILQRRLANRTIGPTTSGSSDVPVSSSRGIWISCSRCWVNRLCRRL